MIKMPDLTTIAGIPTAITDNHNEVLRYWKGKNRTLFHIDAHHDMWEGIKYHGTSIDNYIDGAGISDFICPAVHCKVISDIYWLNPHLNEADKLKYFDSQTRVLDTLESKGNLKWDLGAVWEYGSNIKRDQINLDNPLILDIDLDGFSCRQDCPFEGSGYNTEQGYEKRIEQTMETLSQLKRPDIVTITRSNGKNILYQIGFRFEFVPKKFQHEVEQLTLDGLKELYK
jgi:hypothetical protein